MPENACVFQGFPVVSQSRRPVVPQSRGLVVPWSRRLAVSWSRGLVVSLARLPVVPSHSQAFSVIPSQSRASVNRAPQSIARLSQSCASVNRAPYSKKRAVDGVYVKVLPIDGYVC